MGYWLKTQISIKTNYVTKMLMVFWKYSDVDVYNVAGVTVEHVFICLIVNWKIGQSSEKF